MPYTKGMPIDIPSDKLNSVPPGNPQTAGVSQSGQSSEVDSLKNLPKEPTLLKAVVAQVQAKVASGHYSKPLYDALININTQHKTLPHSQPPITEITDKTIQQILSGKPLQVRVETPAPLKVGQQLKLELQGQALRLLQIAPPSVQAALQNFIRHEINQQNSYTLLLAKLMSIAQTIKRENALTENLTTSRKSSPTPLPTPAAHGSNKGLTSEAAPITKPGQPISKAADIAKSLEQIVQRFISILPTKAQTTTAQGLKDAIKNSGIFYEAQISKANLSKSAANNPADANPKTAKQPEVIEQIKQQIRHIREALNEPINKANQKPSTGELLNNSLAKDLKFNLLSLEKQLQKLQTKHAENLAPKGDLSTGKQADSPVKGSDKALVGDQKPVLGDKPVKGGEQTTIPRDTRAASPIYQRPVPNATASPQGQSSSPYSEEDTTTSSKKMPGSQEWAHPPLPGKINIQAQSVRPNLMASDSLADALISVLIKHTKEAISRINLHQLASMSDMARVDAGPQPTALSFELPILQGTELALFQFRITEDPFNEENANDGNETEKKWVVHMGFDLEGLGAMYCQITLVGVNAQVTFWAEEKHTVEMSQQHLDELRQNLSKLGVTVQEMQCIEGAPPHDESGIKQTLIDIET